MSSKKENKYVFLHEKEKVVELFKEVKLLGRDPNNDVRTLSDDTAENITAQIQTEELGSKSCSCCQLQFDSLDEQRVHFKLDWHRYNLKLSLNGKPKVSEEEFERKFEDLVTDEKDEISGSESEDDDDSSIKNMFDRNPQIFLRSTNGKVISMFKCILFDPREKETLDASELIKVVQNSPKRLTWAVMMLGGGHFAGAIFRGKEVLIHKTFHAYTVRAKQGGSQSSADNRSGGSHPKSAGASLRRYNELSLMQHIQDITETWKDSLKECQLIFYRATSSNKNALFSDRNKILNKNDPRLRTIPFPTKRATFNEVKRVHEMLSKVTFHEKVEQIHQLVEKQTKNKCEKSPVKVKIHRSKSREEKRRELPEIVQKLSNEAGEDENNCADNPLVEENVTLSTSHLKEFEVRKKKRRSKNNKAGQMNKELSELEICSSDEDEENNQTIQVQNTLLTSVKIGNNKMLEELLCSLRSEEESCSIESCLNFQFGDSKTTCLHIAASRGYKNIIWTLLENGADPSVKDKSKKVPYMLATEKDTRNIFRKFSGEYPERYDYKTAQIPPPLSKEAEEEKAAKVNEKKKAQRLIKREKEKLKKAEDQKVLQEKQEKERFLNLSEREKRALAAERRLLNSEGASLIQKQRCFSCGVDITGKTPFEFSDNKFCSVGCVKKYRFSSGVKP